LPSETEKQIEPTTSAEPAEQKSTAREYLESLVVTVILALFGTTFLVQAFKIPSSSMEETLLIGDHLMVDKVGYGPAAFAPVLPYTQVQRDQIVVFRYPREPGTYFVKRVIGLPGDRIHLQDKQVYRNGVRLQEPYAVHKSERMDEYRDSFPSLAPGGAFPDWVDQLTEYMQDRDIVVPPGDYFVMGDNRDFSSDSRYWGFVPRENIVGKPLIIYWSLETTGEEYRETGALDYVVGLLKTVFQFPQRTRWRRMFRIIH
jgi:signal peptidase I